MQRWCVQYGYSAPTVTHFAVDHDGFKMELVMFMAQRRHEGADLTDGAADSVAVFTAKADVFDEWPGLSEQLDGAQRAFNKFVNVTDGLLVVDFACGTGNMSLALANAHKGVRVIGGDITEALIDKFRGKLAGQSEDVKARVSAHTLRKWDASEMLPGAGIVPEGGADVLLILVSLHHMDPAELEVVIHNTWSSVKPGGRVLIMEFDGTPDESGDGHGHGEGHSHGHGEGHGHGHGEGHGHSHGTSDASDTAAKHAADGARDIKSLASGLTLDIMQQWARDNGFKEPVVLERFKMPVAAGKSFRCVVMGAQKLQ